LIGDMCFVRIDTSKERIKPRLQNRIVEFPTSTPIFLNGSSPSPGISVFMRRYEWMVQFEERKPNSVTRSFWLTLKLTRQDNFLYFRSVEKENRQFDFISFSLKDFLLNYENANIELAGCCSTEEKPRLPERICKKEYLGKPHPLAMSLDPLEVG